MRVIRSLDDIGPWENRLNSVLHTVKAPDFFYYKTPTTLFLLATLVNSSYWLDNELFDITILRKSPDDPTLTGEQKAHILLLDIGSTLMDKNFPLNQKTVNIFCSPKSPVYTWAKTFLIQCNKRNTWLKSSNIVSKKQLTIPLFQKGNIK